MQIDTLRTTFRQHASIYLHNHNNFEERHAELYELWRKVITSTCSLPKATYQFTYVHT